MQHYVSTEITAASKITVNLANYWLSKWGFEHQGNNLLSNLAWF